MKKISGSYVKSGKAVPFECSIPSSWSELTAKQYASVMQVLHYRKADRMVVATSLLALLFGRGNYLQVLQHLDDEAIHSLLPCTDFIYEEMPPLKNYYPKLTVGKNEQLAAADDLSNLGFGEWCFVFEFHKYYQLTQDMKWLDKLVATLYRPRDRNKDPEGLDYDGDLRLKFNENLIDARSVHFAKVSEDVKLSIAAWFNVALRQIMERRPHLFPPPPEGETPSAEQITAPEPEGGTWLDVFRELLGPKWGTIEQLKYTNAMFVLDELEARQIEYGKAKSNRR